MPLLNLNDFFFNFVCPYIGCWGVKASQGRSIVVQAANKLFHQNHFHEYDYDQELLDLIIWPIARNNLVLHFWVTFNFES